MGSATVHIDPSNAEQARIWDGAEGSYWAANAAHYDRTVAGYRDAFMDAAAIRPRDAVLDIGCGNGETTRDAARRAPAGSALGVDLSSRMIEVARTLAGAEGVANAQFVQADAQVYPFEQSTFDVAVSRTGAMFFGDQHAAFRNVARALRPGARLVLLNWRSPAENEWFHGLTNALAAGRALPQPPPGAPHPFSLADPGRCAAMLRDAGFTAIDQRPLSAPMWFGADADDAQRFILGFLGWMLAGTDDATRARAIEALHATVTAHESADGVTYRSATWLVSARRS